MITCFGISLFKFSTCVPSCQYFWAEIPMYSPILGESNEEYCLILVWRSNAFLHEQSYVGGVCSGIKGSWIHFVWFFSTVFFSIWNRSALYRSILKITAISYPEKYSSGISSCSLLKYKLWINIRLSDIQNLSESWKLAWKRASWGVQCHFPGLIETGRPQYWLFPKMLLPVFRYTWHRA